MVLRACALSVVILLGAGGVLAQDVAAPADAQLQTEIQRKIGALKLASSRITVSVHDHIVMLEGVTRTLWDKEQAIDAARKTPGIQRVDSTLDIAQAESDAKLAEAVSRQLQGYERMSVYDYVDGVVRNGRVTLTGAVTNPLKSSEITERIQKVQGVRNLDNRVTVLPLSPSDDELRVTIATRIYSDPLFDHYSMAAPPIHVIVNGGHVTLIGIVSSDVERRQAEAIARTTANGFSVNVQIKLSSELRR